MNYIWLEYVWNKPIYYETHAILGIFIESNLSTDEIKDLFVYD